MFQISLKNVHHVSQTSIKTILQAVGFSLTSQGSQSLYVAQSLNEVIRDRDYHQRNVKANNHFGRNQPSYPPINEPKVLTVENIAKLIY